MTAAEPRSTIVATAPVASKAAVEFRELEGRRVNFEPLSYEEAATSGEWNVDRRACALLAEGPGPPEERGPFAVARSLLISYRFADPSRVRAVYDRAEPFERRRMLLVARFFGLRFPMGVQVGGVEEGETTIDQRPVYRFRWHYRTLEGHLERGEMAYELVKWRDTGRIEFRIYAYSQRGYIANPIVRLGFALFARRTQLRFYDRALARMQQLTARGVARRQ